MKKAPLSGSFVEFGVYQGDSLITTIKMTSRCLGKHPTFYGFDSFKGMSPSKVPLSRAMREKWGSGSFSDTSLEFVQQRLAQEKLKAKLVKGRFGQLKPLSAYGINKIRFAHLDADIYEGYRDALVKISPYVRTGTVLLFDEYFSPSDYRYQDVKYHGRRAIDEWEKKTGFNLHLIRFAWTCGLFVIVDQNYLKKYGSYIESLRNDNLAQSLMDLMRQLSHRWHL